MNYSKVIGSKNYCESNPNEIYKNLYKGACVKIKNSQKTFQIVGINLKSKVCWVREWPFALEVNKTFSLEINQIDFQTFCSNSFTKK